MYNVQWRAHSKCSISNRSDCVTLKIVLRWWGQYEVFSLFKICCNVTLVSKTMLLLLLSRFSGVRLCVTPQTAAHQAPPSLGFSRQEQWSGFMKVKSESEVSQSCPTLCNPMDCSPPGSSAMGFSRQEYWSGEPSPSPPVINKETQKRTCGKENERQN